MVEVPLKQGWGQGRFWGILGTERVDGSGYCESLVELEKTIKIEVELRDGDRNEGKELLDQG